MKQIQDLLQDYPWIILVLAGMVLLGAGVALTVVIILRKQEKKKSQPFEVLDHQEQPQAPMQPRPPVQPVAEEDDLTRHLFDYPEMELKSYQLELHDLQSPGEVYRVNVSDRITIGRKEHCMVCIPNNTLSGEHCEIILRNGRLYLHDLNSTNGTFLNGNPNRITEEPLGSGSIIEMGAVKLRVEISIIKL